MLPIRRHRGQKKPFGSIPRIDWSHPLTKGLIFYGYDAGSGPIDLVRGGQRTILNASRITGSRATPYGTALLHNWSGITSGTAVLTFPNSADVQALTTAAPYSFAAALMITVTPGSVSRPKIFGTGSGAESPVTLSHANATATDFAFGFANRARVGTAAGPATPNVFHSLLGVAIGSNDALGYVDGALAVTIAAAPTQLTATAGQQPVFNGTSSTSATQNYSDSYTYYGALWKGRALTAAEARQLHDDPYCFLIYPEDEVFAAIVGSTGVSGPLATTEAADVAALSGSVGVSGPLTTTEATDAAAFAGNTSVTSTGALAVTEATDVAAFSGGAIIFATLAVTEASDVADFAGSMAGISGALAANEIGIGITNSVFPANSAIDTVVGDLFVTGIDTAGFSGVVGISGALAITEAQDTASFAGTLPGVISGTLAVNEAGVGLTNTTFPPNSAVNTVVGDLFVTGVDTAIFNAALGVNGSLAVTEATDTALFNGQLVPIGIAGSLAVIETKDIAAFNGTLAGVSGALAATDARDIAAFNATSVIAAQLAATEPVDTAIFDGYLVPMPEMFGILVVTEAIDTASFNAGMGEEEAPADFANWKFGKRFDRSLTSRFGSRMS